MPGRRLIWLSIALGGTSPARAECLGSCLDGMVAALVSIAVYGVIGLVLLILLIRAKWRRAGLWSLAVVVVLAVGVPLVSQGWLAWKLHRMESHEVAGTPPVLAGRVPLLIAPAGTCDYSACAAVLLGRGKAGVYVLPAEVLREKDLGQPLSLSDLPLEFWAEAADADSAPVREALTVAERQAALLRIDYLIVIPYIAYRSEPGAIEAGLRARAAFAGLEDGVLVRMIMAPLDQAAAGLDLAGLRFDVLDLTLTDRALALPLAPMNDQSARNHAAGAEAVARALCPMRDGQADLQCLALLDR